LQILRRDARRRRGLTALIAAALTLRLAAVWLTAAPADGPIVYEHGPIADNLLAGRGFSIWFLGAEGPTSQQAPWMPGLLALCSLPFGKVTPTSVLVLQLLQCLAGTALCVVAAKLAWRIFPQQRLIGWTVGWLAAIFPPHVYMVTHVQAAVWAALGVTILFALVADEHRIKNPRTPWLLGLVGGWLLLIDPILALVLPVAFVRLFACGFAPRRAAVALACALAVVAPWLARNAAMHGEFVFVKDTFGYAFWQGNNALSWGTDKIPKPEAAAIAAAHDGTPAAINRALWEARHETLYIDDVLLKPTGYAEFAGLTEPARSRLLGRQAWDYVRAEPAAYVERCFRRLRYFLLWDETNPKAMHWAYRASSAAWLSLAAIGLLAARKQWRVLAPSMFAFAAILAFHTLTITSARFRIPIEPLSFVWIAAGFVPAVVHIAGRFGIAWQVTLAEEQARAASEESETPTVGKHQLKGPHTNKAGIGSRSILRRR
jgi:hypothetical protein